MKMKLGIKFQGIKVEGDIIVDGHHRYIASKFAEVELDKIPSIKSSAKNIYNWDKVQIVEDDWDTSAKILMLNEQDAAFNNIELAVLLNLLK
jgi:hypothetical protein